MIDTVNGAAQRTRDLVCFALAFAYESAANITHMTLDGERGVPGESTR